MVPNLKYSNALPVHVGVNELPVGILGIIEQFVITMELDVSILLGNLLHAHAARLESAILDWFGCGHIIVQLDNHSTVLWGNLLHAQGNLLHAQVSIASIQV